MEVGILIANTPSGLHDGHKAVIEYGKQFGTVTVNVVENIKIRNRYLMQGDGIPKYRVDLTKIAADCADIGVSIKLQPYIQIPEERRIWFLNKAKIFVEAFRKDLISPRYIQMAISSVMMHMIYTESKIVQYATMPNIMVTGPDVLAFFYNAISSLENWPRREIYSSIIKGTNGIKESSSFTKIQHDLSDLRKIVDSIRSEYQVGSNRELVRKVRETHPNTNWRLLEVMVYEGGFVKGRLEVTAFSFIGEQTIDVIEEIDYDPEP